MTQIGTAQLDPGQSLYGKEEGKNKNHSGSVGGVRMLEAHWLLCSALVRFPLFFFFFLRNSSGRRDGFLGFLNSKIVSYSKQNTV